ncbi:MAG: type II toxin-antitoxin system VapC family toxin [Lachnospiraceae bacterium]|nr:type II toxin-antitoxin system VapC family toxin [Lachnospiraceae bacterium]
MRILLDTHIALWALTDTTKLSEDVIHMLESGKNEVYYSIASVWEIAIKHKIRPEQMPIHNDPFDRILLAQAKYEKLSFITHDSLIPYYRENCIMSV